jgi:predicted enzyme related to lactoylglutathione lyase
MICVILHVSGGNYKLFGHRRLSGWVRIRFKGLRYLSCKGICGEWIEWFFEDKLLHYIRRRENMFNKIGHITILVRDFDEAIAFYTESMGFEMLTDNEFGSDFRWVTVAPSKGSETAIVFVKADTEEKIQRVGSQVANHVLLVVETDDCRGDYEKMKAKGVKFFGEPKDMPWGIEVVFEDLYGNRYDLLQHNGF